MSRRAISVVAILAALLVPLPAAAEPQPSAHVEAAGNAFTGGLAFIPDAVSVRVGDYVEWENTDVLVPHTATEDHELWDETGTYGGTPFNPPGFGPGELRTRRFAAGAWSYFCRVHPVEMRATVNVPVELSTRRARSRRLQRVRVMARWGAEKLPAGQLFDAQRRRAGGKGGWRWLRRGARARRAGFDAKRGTRWLVRARVRSAAEAEARSGWSPRSSIRARRGAAAGALPPLPDSP